MEQNIHNLIAEEYFKIAEEKNKEYEKETNEDKKIALRIVAAQNYFYAAINIIEAVLAEKKGEHSFNHENRMSKLFEDRGLLGDEITDLYAEIERNQRNKVTYRGDNGAKYENIKKLAKLLMKKNGKQIPESNRESES